MEIFRAGRTAWPFITYHASNGVRGNSRSEGQCA